MLTVKKLQDAKKELLKRGGAIYVVQSAGKVEVWVNSGGYSAVSMGTHVIQILDKGNIDYDNVFYQSKNQEMSLQEFCDMVNKEYYPENIKMEDATLIKSYNIGGKTTELRFTPKANAQTWPGYDDSLPLRYAGYWYGTHDHHEHIGKTEKEAMEYLAENYGI